MHGHLNIKYVIMQYSPCVYSTLIPPQVGPALHSITWRAPNNAAYRRDRQHCWEEYYPIWWWRVYQ